ncbi:hypothetical protein QX233_22415, partial [Chryseobacterium gambrini]
SSLVNVGVSGYALTRLVGRPRVPYRDIGAQVAASLVMFAAVLAGRGAVPDTLGWTFVLVGVGAAVYVGVLLALSARVRRKAAGAAPVDFGL